jgi:hypothetical protein
MPHWFSGQKTMEEHEALIVLGWCPNLIPCRRQDFDGNVPCRDRRPVLTQLVAAIADNGKAVIGVSDRMVSTGDMTLGFESPNRKAVEISKKCAVLLAGTVHEPDLIRDARDGARGKDRIREIADVFAGLHHDLRDKRIENEVLRARAGLKTFAEYHQKQQMLHESVVLDLNERIRKYDLGLEVLLLGLDDQAHILHVTSPGRWRSHDNLGYCTIGMGDRHADNVFAWYRYSSATPRKEALYIAFEAKKKAEMAGGVGQITDAIIIDDMGTHEVTAKTLQTLLEVYNDREFGPQRKTFDDRITNLELET